MRTMFFESLEGRRVFAFTCPGFASFFPQTPDDTPCDHGGQGNSDPNTNAGPEIPPSNSAHPVNYFTGIPDVVTTDLRSYGFGETFGVTRTWSDVNNTGQFGNGWVTTQNAYLYTYSDYSRQTDATIGVVTSGTSMTLFDVPFLKTNGTWNARSFGGERITFSTTTNEWTYTDATGNKLIFNDLPRGLTEGELTNNYSLGIANQGLPGKLKQRIDTNGFLTSYTYNASGNVSSVDRVVGTNGETDRLAYTYSAITNTLGGSVALITGVTLSQSTTTVGPYNPVRSANYDYYNGEGADSMHGRLGDLRLVTIRSGSLTGSVIDQKYYRYYKLWEYSVTGSAGPTNYWATTGGTDTTFTQRPLQNSINTGIKSIVQGESFQRLVAINPSYAAVSDTVLKGFTNKFYEYEFWADADWGYNTYGTNVYYNNYHFGTRYRVSRELSQEAGSSASSQGQGTYDFDIHVNPFANGTQNGGYDPNVWRTRTTEFLSDDTVTPGDNDRVYVYMNELGQTLLRNTVDVSEDVRTVSAFTTSSLFLTNIDVTITSTAHGLVTGDFITMRGAKASDGFKRPSFDGLFKVTVIDADNFFYTSYGIRGDIPFPTVGSMLWAKVLNQSTDYYRYREQSSTFDAAAPDTGYGQLVLHAFPAAITGYDESYSNLVTDNNNREAINNHQYVNDFQGRIDIFTYYDITTATATTAGSVDRYRAQTRMKRGELDNGTLLVGGTLIDSRDYYTRTVGSDTIYPLASMTNYRNTDGTGAETTTYAYDWFTNTTRKKSLTISLPIATTAQNGSNTAAGSTIVYDLYDRPVWTKDADGFISYTEYDMKTGSVTKNIADVNTTLTTTFVGLPVGWATPVGAGLHLSSSYVIDTLGRTTKATDPKGNLTYTIYNDPNFETRIYRGWNPTSGTTATPVEVDREYRPISGAPAGQRTAYTEYLSTSAAPTSTGTAGALIPTGLEVITAANITSLTREITNTGGQTTSTLAYFSMTGVTYATATAVLGVASNDSSTGNYHELKTDYDARGRLNRVQDATGTITRTIYDFRNLTLSNWVGTDDTPTTGTWSPSNNVGANMFLVSENQYDFGLQRGNGLLTQSVAYPGGSDPTRIRKVLYDWRDRPILAKLANEVTETTTSNAHPIRYSQYDNLDRVISELSYDGDNITSFTDSNGDGVPDSPAATLLRSRIDFSYNNQGLVFRTASYSIDQVTGAVSANSLKTDRWFNQRGQLIKLQSPESVTTKLTYDGAGRKTFEYHSDAGGDASWADAANVTGDLVLDQTQWTYDANSNVILVEQRDRFHNMTGTGALGLRTSTTVGARASFETMYYDAIDRPTAFVNVGTNAGSSYTRPAVTPARSDTVLVTSFAYGTDGRLLSTTDPKAIVARDTFDLLGRKTKSVENYIDGLPSAADDQTILCTYNGIGQKLAYTASLPASAVQTTAYVYGTSPAREQGAML